MWRPCLHAKRRFELQHVQEIGLRNGGAGRKAEKLRRISPRPHQRRRGQVLERNHVRYRIHFLKKHLPQCILQLAENEIVCIVDADLTRALIEVTAFQVAYRGCRPGCRLLIQQAGRPSAPVERTAAQRIGQPLERYR